MREVTQFVIYKLSIVIISFGLIFYKKKILRFWGEEKYLKLSSIKETWDPEQVFGCRHCIGDGLEKSAVGPQTMPPWRKH